MHYMRLDPAHRMKSKPFKPPTMNKDRLQKTMEKHQQEQEEQQKVISIIRRIKGIRRRKS